MCERCSLVIERLSRIKIFPVLEEVAEVVVLCVCAHACQRCRFRETPSLWFMGLIALGTEATSFTQDFVPAADIVGRFRFTFSYQPLGFLGYGACFFERCQRRLQWDPKMEAF